jgi:3,4-dihydroxy 2-butanone 4-phosphate synthase / GTP cyclohydrolase II
MKKTQFLVRFSFFDCAWLNIKNRCDCKEQLTMALHYIKNNGGFIIYLQQEGRGIGLANKIAAYSLQDDGMDTVDANLHLGFPDDAREYTIIPSILEDLMKNTITPTGSTIQQQQQPIMLMTNNPRKTQLLVELGVNVIQNETIPMVISHTNQYNQKYMETKIKRMDHMNMAQLLPTTTTISSNVEDEISSTSNRNNKNVESNEKEPKIPTSPIRNGMAAIMTSPRQLLKRPISGGSQIINGASANNINNTNIFYDNKDKQQSTVVEDITAMSADAVRVSLEAVQEQVDELQQDVENDHLIGILANDDGYCLGKQTVLDAIDAVRNGEMIVVVDDLDRENEGDFIMAADLCTDYDMAKIIRYSSGVVCVGMESDRMDELQLPAMVINNEDPKGTAFSVSVDATKEHGITTGISARDRSKTIQLLANPTTTALDFHRPGHIFPLRAVPGGVLQRNGHTEASVDFAKLAGCNPVGVLCEIVSEENPTEMMRLPEIKRFCQRNNYVLTSIADLVQYRKELAIHDK